MIKISLMICAQTVFHNNTHHAISCFENSVDPDQLASKKPADQDLHYFSKC